MNIYLEIFGYIGTALVIISMMMTSVLKLRIINMSGALISLIYAVCCKTWPVVVLNACLICINFVQTVRQLTKKESITAIRSQMDNPTVKHLFDIWQKDIRESHPDLELQVTKAEGVHILYVGEQAIGLFADGEGKCEQKPADALYLMPAYRTAAIKEQALAMLAK